MGAELPCAVRVDGKTTKGHARLESETLEFRSAAVRLSIPFRQIRQVTVRDGVLAVDSERTNVELALGDAAEKWAFALQHPRSRLDKIGAKHEWRASALGVVDKRFLEELQGAVAQLSIGRAGKDRDAIFYGVTSEAQLARLAALRRALKSTGALWVIRPKGRPEISERSVMAAGRAAGLVDVKVVSFSPTHTAEKFVIPVKNRRR
jgi:hypothetical protein